MDKKEPDVMSEDDMLIWAQQVRIKAVSEVTTDSNGKFTIPIDKEDKNFLAKMLKDSDASVFGKRRTEVDQQNANTNAMAAEVIAKIEDNCVGVLRDGRTYDGEVEEVHSKRHLDIDPNRLPDVEIKPGEISGVGSEVVDLDSIREEQRKELKGE